MNFKHNKVFYFNTLYNKAYAYNFDYFAAKCKLDIKRNCLLEQWVKSAKN